MIALYNGSKGLLTGPVTLIDCSRAALKPRYNRDWIVSYNKSSLAAGNSAGDPLGLLPHCGGYDLTDYTDGVLARTRSSRKLILI